MAKMSAKKVYGFKELDEFLSSLGVPGLSAHAIEMDARTSRENTTHQYFTGKGCYLQASRYGPIIVVTRTEDWEGRKQRGRYTFMPFNEQVSIYERELDKLLQLREHIPVDIYTFLVDEMNERNRKSRAPELNRLFSFSSI